jgi:3-(3-hydroxy-phenyl)propionate hydroxylase
MLRLGHDIRDRDGTLIRWLSDRKAAAVVVRPDGFVYAAAEFGQPLPAPPEGFRAAPNPATVAPISNGVSA